MDLKNSVIIVDKPPGHTSHEITTFVKKITGVSRAGHAGTLDPQVSGVLPVALGRATKLLRYIAGKDKTYTGIIKFREEQTKETVLELFEQFTGELTQTPPKISAVRKIPRKRTVHYLRLIELNGRFGLFEAKVDAGTYIRTLCEDIGKKCGGARMEELRRTAVGNINEEQCVKMHEIIDAVYYYKKGNSGYLEKMLIAPEKLIDLPKVFIKESALENVLNGAQIMEPAILKNDGKLGGKVAIYCNDRFVGIGITEEKRIKLERVQL
ncbi:RNA-guided pseudouridylation complex pseudouridine synthase subunit Cbf5 [Candidatus Micrarchaeota archaeon]|nr:RNA-guided pseudouridylation complex pseudouridine synthase subunit Cbf5 [Candidatus Micrarchaeota archaeon]